MTKKFETIVRRYYESFGQGLWEQTLSVIGDDIVHEFNQEPSEQGVALFKEFLLLKERHYQETVQDLCIYSDDRDERGAVEFTLVGRYVKTYPGLPEAEGQPYTLKVSAFLTVTDGKIRRLTTYFNFNEWLNQVSTFSRT